MVRWNSFQMEEPALLGPNVGLTARDLFVLFSSIQFSAYKFVSFFSPPFFLHWPIQSSFMI